MIVRLPEALSNWMRDEVGRRGRGGKGERGGRERRIWEEMGGGRGEEGEERRRIWEEMEMESEWEEMGESKWRERRT